jgi:hypothetical protein
LAQTIVSAVLPLRYAVIPVIFLVAKNAIDRIVAVRNYNGETDPAVLHGRVSAQIPSAQYHPEEAGSLYGNKPARSDIVVLHLGVRFNHPLGPFGPGGQEIADHFTKCQEDLLARAEEFDCIGVSGWTGTDSGTQNSLLTIYYFRTIDGLNKFAHDPIHHKAAAWYNGLARKHGIGHIGVFHEAFYSPAGGYETIFLNMPPSLMGRTNVPIQNEETGEKEFASPLVDASVSALRSQLGRMGKIVRESELEAAVPW